MACALSACNGAGPGASGTSSTGCFGTSGGQSTGGASSTGGGSPIGLWVGGSAAVDAVQLEAGGDAKLSDSCLPPPDNADANPKGAAAFDGQGNLWVQYPSFSDTIYMWTAADLLQSCGASPAIALVPQHTNPFDPCLAMAFDSAGNLWCTLNQYPYEIVGYRAADLAASGSLSPTWALARFSEEDPRSPQDPIGLAFDSAGTLWVGNGVSVIGYSAATLATATADMDAGSGIPGDHLLSSADNLSGIDGGDMIVYRFLAIDHDGNLWVTIEDPSGKGVNRIEEFSSAELAQLDSDDLPAPVGSLTSSASIPNATVWGPIAFDADGNLWAGVLGGQPNLFRFPPNSAADGGYPDRRLLIPGGTSASLAFDPIPAGLPLQP